MSASSRRCRKVPSLRRPASAALLALVACVALGAQWTVDDNGPADFPSIQAAADAAYVHDGDILLVRPGTYYGTVVLDSKDLAVLSEAGPWVTILDGDQSGSVISLQDRSPETRIEGFTIRGGRSETGGGVWIYGGAPVVTRNVIVGNNATGGLFGYGYGGGIEVYASAPTITRNVIRGNTALDGGGGIDIYYATPTMPETCCPLLAMNTIVGNQVVSPSGIGGGILSWASAPRITSSIIAGNSASAGGGIYIERLDGPDVPDVEANLFFDNVPGAAAANFHWGPPVSNRHLDPRLGPGPWTDLWPRSDSPALDAAEPGLAPSVDLTGLAGAVDSDLDGVSREDAGALESRGEVTGLRVREIPGSPGETELTWDDAIDPVAVFDLVSSDGPFTGTTPVCVAASLASPIVTDPITQPAGTIKYYLVIGHGAAAGPAGMRSDGAIIPSSPVCSAPRAAS